MDWSGGEGMGDGSAVSTRLPWVAGERAGGRTTEEKKAAQGPSFSIDST